MAKSDKAKRKSVVKAAAKKAMKPKPTPEQLSDQQQSALFFSWYRKFKPAVARQKEATKDLNHLKKLAEKEGVSWGRMKIRLQLDEEDGEERLRAKHEDTVLVCRWMGVPIGTQFDMFKLNAGEQLFANGRLAALNDEPCKPPVHLNQKDAQRWMEGHAQGRTELNVSRAQGFRPLSEAADAIIPPAPDADDPRTFA